MIIGKQELKMSIIDDEKSQQIWLNAIDANAEPTSHRLEFESGAISTTQKVLIQTLGYVKDAGEIQIF